MTTVAVIDFETMGLLPATGGRTTAIAIVSLEGARVVDRHQSLMNAGVRIPSLTSLAKLESSVFSPPQAVL